MGDNGVDYPKGGITSFSRQMMRVFGNRMALVGISTDDTPIGRWVKKTFNEEPYFFFSVGKAKRNKMKSFIPHRFTSYLKLKKYKKEILGINVDNAFVQHSHYLLALRGWPIANKAYIFHGATNPLEKPRYSFAKWLAPIYERRMFKSLKDYNTIFVAADDADIRKMIKRSGNRLNDKQIIKLPTRFDDTVFYPREKAESAKMLGIDSDKQIFIQVGRLSKQKGCDLIIDSFNKLQKSYPESLLFLVGDGEEKENLQNQISRLGLNDKVKITGFIDKEIVALYYNAADVVLVGSHMEGWSIAMVEALACGKTIVSTKVSGTKEMIKPGVNGFIIENRDKEQFVKKMEESLKLPTINDYSINLSKKYSLATLKNDIEKHWKPDNAL